MTASAAAEQPSVRQAASPKLATSYRTFFLLPWWEHGQYGHGYPGYGYGYPRYGHGYPDNYGYRGDGGYRGYGRHY
jgi:hypothetical protein